VQNRRQLLFGCDARSLAVFRIGIAVLVFVDVCVRFGAADSFYSSGGFLNADLAQYVSPDGYSLSYLSDSVGFQQSIFLVLAGFAVLLGVGCFTRVATFGCWILLASIHVRNPFFLIGGDTLLRMMLFWSLFIPLGKMWSVDQWRRNTDDSQNGLGAVAGSVVCSVGTACLLMQVSLMYLTAGLSKWNAPWFDGTAMEYIFRLDCYSRPLSAWVLQFPTLVSLLTRSTLVIELLFPLVIFLPFRTAQLRLAMIAVFWAFHIGIDLTMDVGKFTYVSMVAWLPFLPSLFWNRFSWTKCQQNNDETRRAECAGEAPWVKRRIRQAGLVVVPAILFGYVVIWNFAGLFGGPGATWRETKPDLFYRIGDAAMLKQNFQMFCIPPRANTTYLFSGRTMNGEWVDLVRHQPARETRPGAAVPAAREWRTLHWHLISFREDPKVCESLLEYHSRVWNRTAQPDQVVREARLERFVEDIGPGIARGSFVHVRNLAEWKDPNQAEASNDQLQQDFDRLMNQMENGGLFPLGTD